MRRITIIAVALATAALATTYIQTSSTGTAPWKPVKDSVSLAHLADSALHAPPSAYADSARVSGLADSAKRSEWAPLDTVRVRGIVGDTAASLRIGMGAYIPLTGSDAIDGNLSSISGNSLGTLSHPWDYSFFRELAIDSLGDRRLYIEQNGSIGWEKGGSSGPFIYCDWSDIYRPLHFGNSPVDFDAYWIKAPKFIVHGGTVNGFLKADGSVDSSGVFAGVTDSARASHISDSAKALAHYGTLAQDTAIAKKVASDTATALRTYIGSASTTGNAATATKLAAARTIATSGDVVGTATAFDGTANITIPTTLPTLLTAGSAGSATSVPTLTWDAKGRLTAVGSAAISIPHTQISDWTTTLSNYDLLSNTTFSVPVTGDGIITLATGARIEGTYDIRWEANSRVEHLQIVVSTTQFGSNYLAINAYKTYVSASSFQRISIYQNSDGSTKYLCLTIGNRNGGTGSVGVKYFGSYGPSSGGTYTGSEVAYLLPTLNTYQNTGAISSSTIYEGGISLSSKYLGINGTASNASALGGVIASSYLLSSAANSTYLHLSGGIVSGLITANGGISGNLTGHASLDIPLTGSNAITGALVSSNSSNIGSTEDNWGTVYATGVKSTGTTSISSFSLSGDTLTLSHADGNSAWKNAIRGSAAGLVLQNAIISGTFSPAVNTQTAIYTISSSDQGKMVISNNQLNLPTPTGIPAGFWCIVNWHVGGGTAKFGPTASGTAWNLRGNSINVNTSMPFTGIVSWDGYNWYAN